MVVRKKPRQRPNPYLEWEERSRPSKQDDGVWCFVHARVEGAAQLSEFLKAVQNGRFKADPAEYAGSTVSMLQDEMVYLRSLVSRRQEGTHHVFFYRMAELVYSDGAYRPLDIGATIQSGPALQTSARLLAARAQASATSIRSRRAIDPSAVAIGIIDDGIAFAHERFRRANGRSRIEAVWLQEQALVGIDGHAEMGRVLTGKDINAMLASGMNETDIYRAAGLHDFTKSGHISMAFRGSHGTHCLDLAAGFDPADDVSNRPIFAVQLPSEAVAETSGVTVGSYVLQALRRLMIWADACDPLMPLVINFSFGILAGPKDGSHALEQTFADLVNQRRARGAPTYLVLPSGNGHESRSAATLEIAPRQSQTLDLLIPPDDHTPNFVEVWIDGVPTKARGGISLTLEGPAGSGFQAVSFDPKTSEAHIAEHRDGIAAMVLQDSNLGHDKARRRLFLAISGTKQRDIHKGVAVVTAGRWQMTLTNTCGQPLALQLYIQRDNTPAGYPFRGRQAVFDHAAAYGKVASGKGYRHPEKDCPINADCTLSAIATGEATMVVGGAIDVYPPVPASYAASASGLQRRQPDCAAVSDRGFATEGILAAGTRNGSQTAMRGTSVAAPQLARAIANHLAAEQSTPRSNGKTPTFPLGDIIKTPDVYRGRLGAFVLKPRFNRLGRH